MRSPQPLRSRHPRSPAAAAALLLATACLAALAMVAAAAPAAGQAPETAKVVPAAPAQPPPAQPQPAPQPAPQEQPAQQEPAPPQAPPPSPPQPSQAAPAQPAAPPAQPQPPQQQAAPPPQPPATQPPAQPPRKPPAPQAQPAPPAPAPQQERAVGPLFGETIEVRVVNVEAVVTDKRGNRVPDLKPEDFRLKVDGKPVKIDFFNEVRGGQAIAPQPGARQTVPGLPDLAPGSPVGTSYLVFIDDYFSVGPRRDEVLRSLRDDLTRLGPEDRMAIVAFDGKHLNMLSSWSGSTRDLGRAIEREIGTPAHGLERVSELRNFRAARGINVALDPVRLQPTPFANSQLNIEERAYVDQLAGQVERAVAAAVSTLRGFASPPGRKVMLLLSGGWPFSPVDYAVNNINRPVLERDSPQGDKLLRPLVDTANRLGYTLYPIDVPGLETEAVNAGDTVPRSPVRGFGLREQEHEETLTFLANETGGKPLLNSLRIASLEHVEADTRSYYWLGFTPSWQGNDKNHRVQLEVLRPGLAVRTRDSFLDRSRKAEVSMMVESALLFGNPSSSPAMPVQLGKPVRKGRSEIELPVTLAIPTESFTSVPLNGKYASEVELRVAVQDERGNRAGDIPVVPLQLQSDKEPARGQFVRYQTTLRLRRIKQHLMFALFDPLSNKITTSEVDFKPD
jgi:VWFA-related protein